MSDKIPEKYLVEDLLRIKGENVAYIDELKQGKNTSKMRIHIDGLNKNIQKKGKYIVELQGDIVDLKRSNEILRERLKQYE